MKVLLNSNVEVKSSLIVWKPLRALLTTASRKAKRMFENNKDWAISSEAPNKV